MSSIKEQEQYKYTNKDQSVSDPNAVSSSSLLDDDKRQEVRNVNIFIFRHNILKKIDPVVYGIGNISLDEKIVNEINSLSKEREKDDDEDDMHKVVEVLAEGITIFTFLLDFFEPHHNMDVMDNKVKNLAKIRDDINMKTKNIDENLIELMRWSPEDYKEILNFGGDLFKNIRGIKYAIDLYIESYNEYRSLGKF